ncbi:MAG: serine hydrolase [Bacteroidales bacterium]|nr:serine hydrolase [Bacteroidales bacterium]
MINKLRFVLFISLLAFGKLCLAQPDQATLTTLNQYYAKAITDWNVPGMAVAIVSGDSVYLAKGYGVRDVKSGMAVDENSLFAVASNTKAFTAAALAILVDQKKIDWNDQVISYLPWFELYDPYVSNQMTIRDLLTHRSGLKTFSGDLIWYGSNYTREQVIRKSKYLKPSYGFREQFGYSNIMYIAAGEIIPAVTGFSYDEFLKNKLLFPLGMQHSVLSVNELEGLNNVAQPHTYVDGKPMVIPWLNWDNVGPAGALISCASDMARWLQFQLNNGITGLDTLISAKAMYEMHSAQTVLPVSKYSTTRFPSTHLKAYGLGWTIMDYQGKKVIAHNGGYDGMISQTVFIPEANIGFVILTNALSNMYYPLMYKTLDMLLNKPEQHDWSAEMLAFMKGNEEREKAAKVKIDASRVPNTHPSLKPDDYTGYYTCPIYDSVRVYTEKGQLMMQFERSRSFKAVLTHWHYDTFTVEFKDLPSLPKGFVTFTLNLDAKAAEMSIFLDNPDFDFTELELKRLN